MSKKEKIEFRYYEIPPNFPLIALLGKCWELQYGTDAMHFHNYLEIGYCYYGEGKMVLGSEEQPYGPGTVTVIPKNCPHHTVGKDANIQKWEYLFVDSERFLKESFPNRPALVNNLIQRLNKRMFVTCEDENEEVPRLLRMILEEMRDKKELYHESVQAKLLALLLLLIRMNPVSAVTDIVLTNSRNLDCILMVLDYIKKNYQEDLDLAHLVQISHMSETHFRRIFTEYMNISPVEYVKLIRIEKACEILSKSDAKLADVAVQIGFHTTGAFIRNFKKIVGELPKDWREKARKNMNNPVNYNVYVLKGW